MHVHVHVHVQVCGDQVKRAVTPPSYCHCIASGVPGMLSLSLCYFVFQLIVWPVAWTQELSVCEALQSPALPTQWRAFGGKGCQGISGRSWCHGKGCMVAAGFVTSIKSMHSCWGAVDVACVFNLMPPKPKAGLAASQWPGLPWQSDGVCPVHGCA